MNNKQEITEKLKTLLGEDITEERFNELTWQLPQNKGLHIITNKGCQIIAAKQDLYVHYDLPIVIQDNIVIKAKVLTKDGNLIESFGEANSKNCKNAYPISMAEKRGHDRVILKACDVYGDIYSEEENPEEFSRENSDDKQGYSQVSKDNQYDGFLLEIKMILTQEDFDTKWKDLQNRLKNSDLDDSQKKEVHKTIIDKFTINNQ
tara:strand:+ start:1216 stop:1830 length:615 start_codon:yes stop_codon:yes gene_type:complete